MKKYLIVFLISMVPLIELRGAIPYAVGFGLPIVPSIIVSVIGNMLPVPFIFLFARRILEWGKDKKYIGKFLLPGTGAWTGTLAASILDMDFKKSVLFVLLGVLLAGAIMLLASLGLFGAIDFIR